MAKKKKSKLKSHHVGSLIGFIVSGIFLGLMHLSNQDPLLLLIIIPIIVIFVGIGWIIGRIMDAVKMKKSKR